jgi:hypothetical protein
MNSILRLIVWIWSIGWLGYGASAFSDQDVVGSWISVCCLAGGITVDGVLADRAEAGRARRARKAFRGRQFHSKG